MLIGNTAGTIGETAVIAILIGAIIMILRGVIDLKIPASYIITFAVFMFLFGEGAVFKSFDTICRQVANRMPNIAAFASKHDAVSYTHLSPPQSGSSASSSAPQPMYGAVRRKAHSPPRRSCCP